MEKEDFCGVRVTIDKRWVTYSVLLLETCLFPSFKHMHTYMHVHLYIHTQVENELRAGRAATWNTGNDWEPLVVLWAHPPDQQVWVSMAR